MHLHYLTFYTTYKNGTIIIYFYSYSDSCPCHVCCSCQSTWEPIMATVWSFADLGNRSYLHLLPRRGLRPSTRVLQAPRSWANTSSCPQVCPIISVTVPGCFMVDLLGVPLEWLPCGVWGWFTESMAYPSPTPFEDLYLCWFLVGVFPQFFVADGGQQVGKPKLLLLKLWRWVEESFCLVFTDAARYVHPRASRGYRTEQREETRWRRSCVYAWVCTRSPGDLV